MENYYKQLPVPISLDHSPLSVLLPPSVYYTGIDIGCIEHDIIVRYL